ncbi:hypothetical protein [Halopenitus persicus]|nr:hypothetical protein [Halopenitus persicus]
MLTKFRQYGVLVDSFGWDVFVGSFAELPAIGDPLLADNEALGYG